MGLLATAGTIHAALLCAAGCTGCPALPKESLAYTLTDLKHHVFVGDENNYFHFSLKKASSKIYTEKVRFSSAVKPTPGAAVLEGQSACHSAPACSQHLLCSGTEAHPDPWGSIRGT